MITGIVGGIFRDVLLNRLPAALSDRKPYGLAAFIGCWFGIVLLSDGVAAATVILVTAASIVLIRMFTLKVNWEIRYRSPLSRRIFPGNGPISLTRILRRSNTAPKPPRLLKTPKSSKSSKSEPAASAPQMPRIYKRANPANLPSAAPWRPIDAPLEDKTKPSAKSPSQNLNTPAEPDSPKHED